MLTLIFYIALFYVAIRMLIDYRFCSICFYYVNRWVMI